MIKLPVFKLAQHVKPHFADPARRAASNPPETSPLPLIFFASGNMVTLDSKTV